MYVIAVACLKAVQNVKMSWRSCIGRLRKLLFYWNEAVQVFVLPLRFGSCLPKVFNAFYTREIRIVQ